MSSESDRSEQEREAARLERERKRAAERGESAPAAPPPRDLPPQVPPLASGAPKLDQPGGDKPASEAPRPAPAAPARPQQPATAPPAAPPAPPRKVTDDEDERPIGTVRPGAATAVPPAQPQARRRSPGRHALLFGLAAVVVIAIAFFANGIFEPFKGDGSGSVSVHIPTGVSAGEVGKILAAKGVISSPFFFELRATLGGDRANLRAGTYTLSEGMSNGAALAVLTNVTKAAAVISVLIPEGPSRQEVAPIVARQAAGTRRISPLGSVICAHCDSRATSTADDPAERHNLPPRPACNSTLCTCIPRGMADIGRQFPTSGGASAPLRTVPPTFKPSGARMNRFSPSA